MEEQEFSPLVRAVGVIDENRNFIPYGSTMVAKGIPVFVFDTKEEYDQHAPTLPEPCVVITLDDIDTGGFEFDAAIDPESENAVQNKVIAAALEALRDKANFDRPGMVQFTDSPTVTDRNSGLGLSAVEKNSTVEGSLANETKKLKESLSSFHPTNIPNMQNTNNSDEANVILYKYSDTNWAGIGCTPSGEPLIRFPGGAFSFGYDGIYFNGNKITN